MEIIREFEKSPMIGQINIDPAQTAGDRHLRAIIHNESFANNYHSRIKYKNPAPEYREITHAGAKQFWIFMPELREYKYRDRIITESELAKDYRKIVDLCKPSWEFFERNHNAFPNGKFIIDMRSLTTKGPSLFAMFAPFIISEEIQIIKTKNPQLGKSLFIGNQPPYISKEPIESKRIRLVEADISFIIDSTCSKIKDLHFSLLMASLTKRYSVYGDIGDHYGYVFNQYRLDTKKFPGYFPNPVLYADKEMCIRIPDTLIETGRIDPHIPADMLPYRTIV